MTGDSVLQEIRAVSNYSGVVERGNNYNEEGIEAIKRKVSSITGISVKDMVSYSRKQEIVKARHLAINECHYQRLGHLAQIGSHFSIVHHTTIIYIVNTIRDRCTYDKDLKDLVNKIRYNG
jgi:chromosomal replication initiation ATPase DnaA